MKTKQFVLFMLAATVLFGAASCGEQQSSAEDGLAGVWEMRYQDAVGQSYLNVLELRGDGTYATYMQDATPDDHGTFKHADGSLSFQSNVDPALSRSLPFEQRGDLLKIFITPFPGAGAKPLTAEWRRSDALPAFQTAVFAGDELPIGLPGMVAAAMASQALPWRADALPVSLEVKISPPGRGVQVRLRFLSPSTNKGLQLDISKYVYKSLFIDGSRMERRPLPAEFIDLVTILDKAASGGVAGALRRADIRTYKGAGPAWMISSTSPQGATYSAITGERITSDVTGYIAQYEADWAKNAAIWRKVFERYASCPPGEARDRLFGTGCMNAKTKSLCLQWGGRWHERGFSDAGYCSQN